jgi:hypothetical protein
MRAKWLEFYGVVKMPSERPKGDPENPLQPQSSAEEEPAFRGSSCVIHLGGSVHERNATGFSTA